MGCIHWLAIVWYACITSTPYIMNKDNIQAVATAASIATMIVMAIVFAMLTA